MDYVLLDFGTFQAYQESQMGQVTRYLSTTGEFLFTAPPADHHGGIPIDSTPPRLDWMT